jgi:hypothetical protein
VSNNWDINWHTLQKMYEHPTTDLSTLLQAGAPTRCAPSPCVHSTPCYAAHMLPRCGITLCRSAPSSWRRQQPAALTVLLHACSRPSRIHHPALRPLPLGLPGGLQDNTQRMLAQALIREAEYQAHMELYKRCADQAQAMAQIGEGGPGSLWGWVTRLLPIPAILKGGK